MRKLILACSILALLAGSAPPAAAAQPVSAVKADSPQLAAFKQVIRKKYDMKEKAFAAHDAETILTRFYAADAVSVGEGFGIFTGRAELRPLYEKAVTEYTVKVTSVHTVVAGNAGWDWADLDVMPVDPKEKPFTLVILFLWQKVQGQWICKGDFYANGSFRSGKLTSPAP